VTERERGEDPSAACVPLLRANAADMADRTPDKERREGKRVDTKDWKDGDTVYVMDTTWLEEWKRYSNYDDATAGAGAEPGGPPPGPISNSGLVETLTGWRARAPQLNGEVREDTDYCFVSARFWGLLHGWYGGGPELPRAVYAEDEFGTQVKVETRPQACVVFVPGETGEDGTETVTPLADSTALPAAAEADGVGGGAGGGAGGAGGDDGEAAEIEGSKLDESDLTDDTTTVLFSRRLALGEVKEKLCKLAGKDPITSRLWVFVRPPGGDPVAGEWQVVHDGQKVAEVARNDAFTKFLVDTEVEGKWGRKAPDDERKTTVVTDVPAWRAALEPGARLDAQDGQNKWYESEIVEVNTFDPKDATRTPSYRVHFRSWESKWDAYIAMDSDRLQPAWTKIKNFRDFRVTDRLEVKVAPTATSTSVRGGKWFPCRVEAIDEEAKTVTIKITSKYRQDEKTFAFDSPLLCPFPTHCSKSEISTSSYSYTSSYSSSRYNTRSGGWNNWRTHTRGRPAADGAVGLVNLGNTCFMNSMLQCLSNTGPLTEYFLDEKYKPEINKSNPLGMGGRLAEAYASMLKAMWGGEYSVVCPSDVKENIGQHAPQFAGYQQQDSQELMNFLLDGLHEDLNRVKKKPYVEKVEGNGRPDGEVAKEAWEGHLARNRSEVLDIFGGQLRSRGALRCVPEGVDHLRPVPVLLRACAAQRYAPDHLYGIPVRWRRSDAVPATAAGGGPDP